MKLSACRQTHLLAGVGIMLTLAVAGPIAQADTVVLTPTKDNSIFSATPDNSNALGVDIFSGAATNVNNLIRGLLAFDIAGNIAPGSTITSVSLQLNVNRTPITEVGPRNFSLFKVLADWGEGTSTAFGGLGAAATAGDATWNNRLHPGTAWTSLGGDFAAGSSAVTSVPNATGLVSFASTASLVADVQDMLDNPGSNFGWILVGDEGCTIPCARRFDSRETVSGVAPQLTVEFDQVLFVALESFTADFTPNGVVLRWKTSMELDNFGFRVLRQSRDEAARVLTPQLIPSAASQLSGASYEFVDREIQKRGVVEYYLEDISTQGVVTRHGPAEVRFGGGSGWGVARPRVNRGRSSGR